MGALTQMIWRFQIKILGKTSIKGYFAFRCVSQQKWRFGNGVNLKFFKTYMSNSNFFLLKSLLRYSAYRSLFYWLRFVF